jgi:hypothetical protein
VPHPTTGLERAANNRVSLYVAGTAATQPASRSMPLRWILFGCVACLPAAVHADPSLPIRSGQYLFQLKDAEFPTFPSVSVRVTISGRHIKVISADSLSTIHPKGTVVDEGTLMWHAASRQWIIGEAESDKTREDVGGCSAGPAVVDLVKKIYWTC